MVSTFVIEEFIQTLEMKEKIKTALKQKYSNTGLGDDVFDGVAEILSHNVKEEDAIDTAVSGCEGLLKVVQGALDKERQARSEAEKKVKAIKETNSEQKDEPKPTSTTEETKTTDEFLAMQKAITELTKQISEMKQTSLQKSKLEQLTSTLKKNKVPEAYYKPILNGRTFGEDIDVDAYATEVVNGWTDMQKEIAEKRFEGVNPPDKGEVTDPKSEDPLAKLISKGTEEIVNSKK